MIPPPFCLLPPTGLTQASVEGSHLLDDSLVGAVVLTQQNAAGVFCGVVLVQPVQQRHVQVTLPCKFAVHKRTQLEEGGKKKKAKLVQRRTVSSQEPSHTLPLARVIIMFLSAKHEVAESREQFFSFFHLPLTPLMSSKMTFCFVFDSNSDNKGVKFTVRRHLPRQQRNSGLRKRPSSHVYLDLPHGRESL